MSYEGREQPHLNNSWGKTFEVKKNKTTEYIWTEKKNNTISFNAKQFDI